MECNLIAIEYNWHNKEKDNGRSKSREQKRQLQRERAIELQEKIF